MKPATFDYVAAENLNEALTALSEAGEGGRVIAGGQSLMAILNMRLARPDVLVDITRIAELSQIRRVGDWVEIGAAVTQATLLNWPELANTIPLLAKALPHVGHIQTRNRGTICGSLCHADPSSEIPLIFRALDGQITLRSTSGRRELSASDFQIGMLTTAKRADEIAVSARFPVRKSGFGYSFAEFNRRHGDFAIVALAAISDGRTARLCVGGVGDTPMRKDFDDLGKDGLASALNDFAWECGGYDDIHATARHRRELVRRLGRKAIEEAISCRV